MEDELKVWIPRLEINCKSSFLRSAVESSVKRIGFLAPTDDQLLVVTKFVEGKDVFVSLPTGSGKSICYACLPGVFDGLSKGLSSQDGSGAGRAMVIVVSPLNALMYEQVGKFQERGLKATILTSNQSIEDTFVSMSSSDESPQLLYFSPEALLRSMPLWRELLKPWQVALVVDEAHLVEKWGKEFRTDFSHIGEMRSLLPKRTNVMALTATANQKTRKVIISSLEMFHCYTHAKIPNKLNIYYSVLTKPSCVLDVFHPFITAILNSPTSAEKCLCFCRTYDEAFDLYETVALQLGERLFPLDSHPEVIKYGLGKVRVCEKFDACTSVSVKSRIIESFSNPSGAVRIVISTVAFAMGIDVPNIRTVIHWSLPNDIESYVQETGRGGRDGLPSKAILYYNTRSVTGSAHVNENMKAYCLNSSNECRRVQLMRQFSETTVSTPNVQHLCCDVCYSRCKCTNCLGKDIVISPDDIKQLEDWPTDVLPHQRPLGLEGLAATIRTVTDDDVQFLKQQLLQLKMDIVDENSAAVLVGANVLSGLTESCINSIIRSLPEIDSEEKIEMLGATHEWW